MSLRTHSVLQFAALFAFWLALSDQYSVLFLSMGAVSALVVTALTRYLVASCLGASKGRLRLGTRAWRIARYVVWVVGRMLVASAQVAYFVLHPRMPLHPAVLRFRTTLRSPLARVIVANTITLVPGTLTLRLDDDEFLVHALVPASANDLLSGRMQQIVGSMFLEEPDDPLTAAWEPPGDHT